MQLPIVSQALRREIERRLDRVADIYFEPKLLTLDVDNTGNSELPPYYFRMKAVDNMKYLGKLCQFCKDHTRTLV